METNQDLRDPEKTFSQAPTVSPSLSSTECECECHQDPPRMWLLYASFILILVSLTMNLTLLVLLIVPNGPFLTTTSSNITTTVTTTVTAPSAPTITPHAGRRSTNPYTTCLLGPTQDDMTSFMYVTNPRVYFGQSCAQVQQEGLMPYEFNYVYEISVAPPASSKRGEGIEAGTEMLEKRNDFSSAGIANAEFGPEHAHYHPDPGPKKVREEIQAGGAKGKPGRGTPGGLGRFAFGRGDGRIGEEDGVGFHG